MKNYWTILFLLLGAFFLQSCDKDDESCDSNIDERVLKLWTLKTAHGEFEHIGQWWYSNSDSVMGTITWSNSYVIENGHSHSIDLNKSYNDSATTYLDVDTAEYNLNEKVLFKEDGKYIWYRTSEQTYESHATLDTFYRSPVSGNIQTSESEGYYSVSGNRIEVQGNGPLNGMFDISFSGDNLIIERHSYITLRTDRDSTYDITTETTDIEYVFEEE